MRRKNQHVKVWQKEDCKGETANRGSVRPVGALLACFFGEKLLSDKLMLFWLF